MKKILTLLFLALASIAWAQNESLTIDKIQQIKRVREVEISPDGQWLAYAVNTKDTAKDKSSTRIWMVPTSGGDAIPMTGKDYSASTPRWSPDGKFLSFLAAKGEKAKTQVWTLNRLGGEAEQVTKVKQGVSGYEWSPDGKRLLLTMRDPKPSDLTADTRDDKKPKPHVIDRAYFKRDYVGYLDRRRTHLYVYTPGDSAAVQITSGDYDDSQGKWSPDGNAVVFVSNRTEDPDLIYGSDLWIVDPNNTGKGAGIKKITSNPLNDYSPSWSPDGKTIVYLSNTNADLMPFDNQYITTVPAAGGEEKVLTRELDRNSYNPSFSKDGKLIYFRLETEGEWQLASIKPNGKDFQRIVHDKVTVKDYAVGPDALYTLESTASTPVQHFRIDDKERKILTNVNEELFDTFTLGSFEKVRFNSKDGTPVEGFLVKPPDFDASRTYPLILWIHGGPQSQFSYDSERITPFLYAENQYQVLLVNPRGSTGYGEEFCAAIFADWGNLDYDDVMAGVDHVIGLGSVDEERLGLGGWSYGGILTNYVITKTQRFKAAMSGASLGLIRANFGHDHYVKWYKYEFGMPYENPELWERLSPFNDVEKITTPTLWMGGALDWNVPIMNSEQMYLAMKTLGRETELVVYPGEHHGIRRPSFQKDRFQRWLAWYDKYLKPTKQP